MSDNKSKGNIIDWKVLSRLFSFVKPYQSRFGVLVIFTFLASIIAPISPLLIRQTIDGPIKNKDLNGLWQMLAIMLGFLVLQSLIQLGNTFMAGWVGQTIIRDIRVKLYDKILKHKLSFYDETPIGRLVTRTISDIETLADVFSDGIASIAGDMLQLVLILAVMFYIDWRLSLVSLSMVPLMLTATYIFKEKIKKSFTEVRNAVAALNVFLQEHITGMSTVQIFNSENEEFRKFKEINAKHRDENIKGIMYYSIYFPVADVIAALGTGLVVWYGSNLVLKHDITYGTITSFVMFINLFFRPIRMLADRMNVLQMGVVSMARIFDLLDSKDLEENTGQVSDPIKGHVAFENVSFAYQEPNFILNDISFEVPIGKSLAFVGATGAGKSSIINLLTHLYPIQKGKISIDGIALQDWNWASLRGQIAYVLQDIFFFSDTILQNITLGNPNIPFEKVVETAKLVGIHDFIESLPNGYQHQAQERGATLSVGQRQLISFVRALVTEPKIIVLDEATSSVDSESEALIQSAIQTLLKNRTSIVIAHRLSTIQNANEIVVLEKGKIIERGTHSHLLEKDGHYAHLYKIQFEQVGEND